MALKQFKPNTPGQRALVLVDKSDLYKGKPVKKLTEGLNKAGGRNNSGKITMWQRGGGHKRRYRIIDFKRILAQKERSGMKYYMVEQDMTFDGLKPLEAVKISHKGLKTFGFDGVQD